MDPLAQQILDYLQRSNYKPKKPKELSKKLGIKKKQQAAFRLQLDHLLRSGRIRKGNNELLRPRADVDLIAGIIRRTRRGSGYLIPHDKLKGDGDEGSSDVFIDEKNLGDAHTGDEVLVGLLKRRRRDEKRCGRLVEILNRASRTFVGTYLETDGQGIVQVDGTTFNKPISVGDPGAKGAVPDDKVVIEMLKFPSHIQIGEAVLTRVLGPSGETGIDTLSIIHEFGLPEDFSEQVLNDARLQAQYFDETDFEGRVDLTGETIVTIDPVDAQDFDDAISLKRTDQGQWQLGVHIADVAQFVPPGTPLDREARRRGNSVYLPGQVLPMLPEVISNGLASLQQGRVRYAKSVFIQFSADGVPLHSELANSAVKVTRRFSYEQVLPIIQDPETFKNGVSNKLRRLLDDMHELAMILRKRRFQAGTLDLSLPEISIDYDSDGKVAGVHQSEIDVSHQIIEEFMLAANFTIAQMLTDLDIVFLRRVHGDPDFAKLKSFAEFAKTFGFPLKNFQSRPALQELLEKVKHTPLERAFNYALLRSMQQANYTGQEMGHYALGVENYCHFTSPIRRYPDLTVHRLIDVLASGKKSSTELNEAEATRLGKHCSNTERRAERAERELKKIKLLTYLESRIGQQMDAVITGVERFGFFCQGLELPVDGLVHISWLSDDDHFYYDRGTFSIIGRRTGTQYRLGDQVRVKIVHVDVDRRKLDFHMASDQRRPTTSKKKRKLSVKDNRSTTQTFRTGKKVRKSRRSDRSR